MPNQIPYGFYNPNINNVPEFNNLSNNQSVNKLYELEERIRILENDVIILKQKEKNKNYDNGYNDNFNYKYDYKTSMHMM